MGLLDKIRALLGGGDTDADGDRQETTVSVERNGRTEAAVKGTDTDDGDAEPVATDTDDGDAEPVATDTEASASTGSLVDEGEGAAEPAEAAGGVADEESPAEGTDELDTDAVVEEAEPDLDEDEPETEADGTDGESVDVIKGIGPAYADRLAEVGVHTVADLAAADAATLAGEIDLSEKRVGRWVKRAQDR